MPFATATWTDISTLPSIGIAATVTSPPVGVAYDALQNIIIVARTGAAAVLDWIPGDFCRSADNGASWVQTTTDEADGGFHAPTSCSYLRDPLSGVSRFVAIVVRITFVGTTRRSVRARVYTSNSLGTVWTPGQILIDLPDDGSSPASGGSTSFATLPRTTPSDPLIHIVMVSATRGATTSRASYRSTDLGVTWTAINDPGPFGPYLAVDNRRLVVALNGGVATSDDEAQTWQVASGGFGHPSNSMAIASFGGGPLVACEQATLTDPMHTQISCDRSNSWPPGNTGPSFGIAPGSLTAFPGIGLLGGWEVIMAAADDTPGTIEAIYSRNGGETTTEVIALDTGTGVIAFVDGIIKLADGRPIIIAGRSLNHVFRSSDVATGAFGARIYCLTAPAPGVGVPGLPDPCGDFYNPCPQECPADPPAAVGLIIDPQPPVILGDSTPYGDLELMFGVDAAIYGGGPTTILSIPTLGIPAGCGQTFINEPCAVTQCP